MAVGAFKTIALTAWQRLKAHNAMALAAMAMVDAAQDAGMLWAVCRACGGLVWQQWRQLWYYPPTAQSPAWSKHPFFGCQWQHQPCAPLVHAADALDR
jgi:hypothetical protein